MYPQRRGCQERLTDRSLRGKDLRLWFGSRHPQWRQLHRPGQRQCPATSYCLWPTRAFFSSCNLFLIDKYLCTYRLDFLWSGCLQRASSSVSTQCRATSGPTEFCCGRSSHWVGKQTDIVMMGIFLVLAADSVLKPVQVKVLTPMLPWTLSSTRWSRMASTWRSRTLPHTKCELLSSCSHSSKQCSPL